MSKNRFDISDFVNTTTQASIIDNLVKRVKKRRKEMKCSQKELAIKSCVSYASIRRFENKKTISLVSLIKIAEALDSLEDFNYLFKNKIIKNLKDY